MANDIRPVIASSDRFATLLPYTSLLLTEAPNRWGGIMPWGFPQNAPQATEEAFLREQFPAVEVQVQGFRFLKQVWYCIALNNFEVRIPHMIKAWFEQKGPEYLDDPTFESHLLHPAACAQTFFEASEIDLYGPDFLDVAVKAIQFELRERKQRTGPCVSPTASRITSGDKLALDLTPRTTVAVKPSASQVTHTNTLSQAHSPEWSSPIMTAPNTVLKPTATVFSSSNTTVQPMASPQPVLHSRSFSGESPSIPLDLPQNRPRGSGGKRNSLHDRLSFNPLQSSRDSRFTSSQTQQHPRQQVRVLPANTVPQFATRGPSTWALPIAPGQPPPSRPPHSTYHSIQVPPGFEPHPPPPPARILANHPNAFTPDQPHYAYGPPQITERPINHGNARNFEGQPGYSSYDQEPDRSQMKRREGNTSYGGKCGSSFPGHRGRGRGRGRNNTGRCSIGEEKLFGNGHPSGASYGQVGFGKQDGHRQNSPAGRRVSENYGCIGLSKRDENTAPYARHSEQFPYGPTQFSHDPRRASHSQAAIEGMQPTLNTSSLAPVGPLSTSLGHLGHQATFRGENGGAALPDYGCTRKTIALQCLHAKKLVVFGIPEHTSEAAIADHFSKFGHVSDVGGPVVTHNLKGEYSRTYITFVTVDGARKCIQQPPASFHGHRIDVEVAREFWDPFHDRFQARRELGISPHDLKNIAPPAMHYVQTSAINSTMSAQAPTATVQGLLAALPIETFPKGAMSANATPTVPGPGTPKGRKKNNKSKKTKNTTREGDILDRAFEENARNNRLAFSPKPDEYSSVAETVLTSETTPGRRPGSLQPESLVLLRAVHHLPPTNTAANAVVRTHVDEALNSRLTASGVEAKPMAISSSSSTEETADAQSKSEEEPIDDSTHTASATAAREFHPSIDANAEPTVTAGFEAKFSATPLLQPISSSTYSEAAVEEAEAGSRAEAVIGPLEKDAKKIKFPVVIPKVEVVIAMPQREISESMSDTVTSTKNDGEAPLTVSHQRAISVNLDRPSASFASELNISSSPLPDRHGTGQVQSRKEAKAKAEMKVKGPAQTESFSLFSKPRKAKNSYAGKSLRVSSEKLSPELPKPDGLLVRKVTANSKPTPTLEQLKMTSASRVGSETVRDLMIAIKPNDEAAERASSDVTDVVSDVSFSDTAADVASPAASTSILRRISGLGRIFGPDRELATGNPVESQPAEKCFIPSDVVAEKPETAGNIACSKQCDDADIAETLKKRKKKSKKSKKCGTSDASEVTAVAANASQPKAVVLEMSQLAPSNETGSSSHHLESSDSASAAAGSTAALVQKFEQGNQSPPGKVKPPRRLKSDNHLVQAPPSSRRARSQFKGSAKKSSDSSDSPQKATSSLETTVAPKGHQTSEESNHLRLYVILPAPDSVNTMKMRMKCMVQQEKMIKEQKKLAMQGGRVLCEIKDVVENNGGHIAEAVQPME